jgi:hypothetical protein
LSFSADREPEIQKVVNRLGKMWDIQHKEIATAHIVYRHAIGDKGLNRIKSLTKEQIDSIVSQTDFSSPESAFNELVENLLILDRDFILSKEVYCVVPVKYIEKTKISERNREKDTLNLQFHTTLFDGTRMMLVSPFNKQVSVSVPKGGVGDPLGLLRIVPRSELLSNKFHYFVEGKNIKIESDEDGWFCRYLVDSETGLTIDYFSHHTQTESESKLIGRGRYQRCFSSVNSINFPRVAIQVEYKNYLPTLINIVYVEKMSFNISIPEQVYQLALPKGMKIFEDIGTGHRSIFTDVQEPIDDISEVLLPTGTEKKRGSALAFYIKRFCIFAGIVLLVIGLFLKIQQYLAKK